MYSTQIYAQLQNVTYSAAIDRYNSLKARFFAEYSAVANQEEKKLIEQVENEIAQDIENNPIEMQEELTAKLFERFADIMVKKLEGSNAVSQIRSEYQSKEKGSEQRARQAAKALSLTLMPEQELADYVRFQLTAQNIGQGFDISDIVHQLRSYSTKMILTRRNASAKSYIRSTKGYYREAIIYRAFSKLNDYVEGMPVVASTGAYKNLAGQDTVYDTYINFFDNLQKGFETLVNENVDIGYGMQVKSWTAPWESDKASYYSVKYGYGIGNRKALLDLSGLGEEQSSLFSWCRGVIFLEQHAIEAIGENQVGFITGNNFYWTADLISAFRAMNYFLAFGYSANKPLSPTVSWQMPPYNG